MGDDIFEIIEVENDNTIEVSVGVQSEDSDDPDSKGFIGDEGVRLEDS